MPIEISGNLTDLPLSVTERSTVELGLIFGDLSLI